MTEPWCVGCAFELGPGREFDRIRAIERALGPRATALGDDCAVLATTGAPLAVSTDVSVEGVHFRRDWLSLPEIGWRATAAALSDLAAEGASATAVLCALVVPAEIGETQVVELMRGVGEAAAAVGAQVVGGDLSSGSALALAVTVLGEAPSPVTRGGAQPGDGIWVTGRLGGARAALASWRAGREPAAAARSAFAHPEPRIAAGRWLAERGARAMVDLSDGLAGDARHIAAASHAALVLDLALLPLAPDVGPAARADGVEPELFAAAGGEDYELLAALPPAFGAADAAALARDHGIGLTRIGGVEAGAGVRLTLRGVVVDAPGFDHFG